MVRLVYLLLQWFGVALRAICQEHYRGPCRERAAKRLLFRASGPCWEKPSPVARSILHSSAPDLDEGANSFRAVLVRTSLPDSGAWSGIPGRATVRASRGISARACPLERTGLQCSPAFHRYVLLRGPRPASWCA